jgi:hypothetical protein
MASSGIEGQGLGALGAGNLGTGNLEIEGLALWKELVDGTGGGHPEAWGFGDGGGVRVERCGKEQKADED